MKPISERGVDPVAERYRRWWQKEKARAEAAEAELAKAQQFLAAAERSLGLYRTDSCRRYGLLVDVIACGIDWELGDHLAGQIRQEIGEEL